jgi:hypothetical protein
MHRLRKLDPSIGQTLKKFLNLTLLSLSDFLIFSLFFITSLQKKTQILKATLSEKIIFSFIFIFLRISRIMCEGILIP